MSGPQPPEAEDVTEPLARARSPHATAEELAALANDLDPEVRVAVADHPATPLAVLRQLLPTDVHTWHDQHLLLAIVRHDASDADLLRAVAARAPAAIALPNGHVAFGAALALFERPDTPDDALDAVLDDPASPTQLRKEAARQTVHPVIRERLAHDPDESVRRNASKPRPRPPA